MFAVIKTGGKQYRVAPRDVIEVERLPTPAGEIVELTDVLAMDLDDGVTLGKPLVEGARVAATVLEHRHADKIIVFRKLRRKNYRRTRGHRQNQTVLRIEEILAAGESYTPPRPESDEKPAKAKKSAKRRAAAKKSAKSGGAKSKADAKPKAATGPKAKAAVEKKPVAEKKPAVKDKKTPSKDEETS